MTEPDEQVQALAARIGGAQGVDVLVVDEIVHDAASQLATAANNGGPEAQAAFLIEQYGYAKASALLDEQQL